MIEAKVVGIPELRAALASVAPKLQKRALRNALAAGARVVRDAARSAAPVIHPLAPAVIRKIRKPRTLRNAISVRTSKIARRSGDVGVFVNVRPAKGSARGTKNPNDPFYWRWVNFGFNPAGNSTGGKTAKGRKHRRKLNASVSAKIRGGYHFLERGAKRLGDALQIFIREIGPQIEKLNK